MARHAIYVSYGDGTERNEKDVVTTSLAIRGSGRYVLLVTAAVVRTDLSPKELLRLDATDAAPKRCTNVQLCKCRFTRYLIEINMAQHGQNGAL